MSTPGLANNVEYVVTSVVTDDQHRVQDEQAEPQHLHNEQTRTNIDIIPGAFPLPANDDEQPQADTKTHNAEAEKVIPLSHDVSSQVIHHHDQPGIRELYDRSSSVSTKRIIQRYKVMRDKLQRMAQLRMDMLAKRVAVDEEGAKILNIHTQLMQDMRELIESIKRRFNEMNANHEENIEDLVAWEDCLIGIEDYAYESEIASHKFTQDQRQVLDLEEEIWEICEIEKDLSEEGLDAEYDLIDLPGVLTPRYSSAQVPSPASTIPEVKNHSSGNPEGEPASPAVRRSDREVDDEILDLDSYDFSINDDDNSLSTISAGQPRPDPSTPKSPQKSNRDQDTLGNGDQFGGTDNAMYTPTKIPDGPGSALHGGFSENDLIGFTRWLIYGNPWTPDFAGDRNNFRAVFANPQFLRAWISYSVGSFYSGTFFTPHVDAGKHEDNVSILDRYIKSWMSDPSEIATVAEKDVKLDKIVDRHGQRHAGPSQSHHAGDGPPSLSLITNKTSDQAIQATSIHESPAFATSGTLVPSTRATIQAQFKSQGVETTGDENEVEATSLESFPAPTLDASTQEDVLETSAQSPKSEGVEPGSGSSDSLKIALGEANFQISEDRASKPQDIRAVDANFSSTLGPP